MNATQRTVTVLLYGRKWQAVDEDLARESKLTSMGSVIVRGECGSSGSEPFVAARKDRWGQYPMTHDKTKADAVVRDKVPFFACQSAEMIRKVS
jgi:hypothetical protein